MYVDCTRKEQQDAKKKKKLLNIQLSVQLSGSPFFSYEKSDETSCITFDKYKFKNHGYLFIYV